MRKDNVLILCTGNSVRSQMAEGFLKQYAGERFTVYSAGLKPVGIHPMTTQVMDEAGVDISGQSSKSVKEFLGRLQARYVITVCEEADADCPMGLWSSGRKLYWPFDDPSHFTGGDEEKLAQFRVVRDQIRDKIQLWLKEIDTNPEQDA